MEKNNDDILNKVKKLVVGERDELGNGALSMVNEMLNLLGSLVSPFTQVQNSAIELAKTVGLSSKSIMQTSKRLLELNSRAELSASYGVSNKEILDLQETLLTSIGRNVRIDEVGFNRPDLNDEFYDSALENTIAAYELIGGQKLGELVAGYDRIGKTTKSAAKVTGKLFYEASKYGINFQEYSKNFISNLNMAQKLNFRNGVDGLREMARRATELKQDMSQVAQFAEKVGTVTGAVETAAQLQVLGGSFAAMANPLAMLNESLVNPENLQKRLINMTESLAVYDPSTHQVRMNAVDRQRVRRAAEAMGVNPDNLLTQALAQGRRREIEKQMTGFGGMSDDVKNLLKNVGEIDEETGVAGATINGKFRSIGEISSSSKLQEDLIAETRSESDDVKQIVKSVMGIEKEIAARREGLKNEAARNVIKKNAFGESTIDLVKRQVENVTPEVSRGAGKVDMIGRWRDPLIVAITNAFTEPLKAIDKFNGTNPEKFGEEIENSIKKAFGNNELTNILAPELKSAGTWAANLAKSLNDFTKKYGADFFAPLKDTIPEANLEPGRTTTNDETLKQATAGSSTIEATQSRAEIDRAAATITASNVGRNGYEDVFKSWEGTYLAPVAPILRSLSKEGVKVTIITGNDTSIPSATVSQPTASITGGNGQTQGTNNGENQTITINLNGEFKFVGQGGEVITKQNLEEIINNSPSVQKALANMIDAAKEEIIKRNGHKKHLQ